MSSENENIEAKLCSYVEGDLDAAGRAEIEKYLVANPRYRPLIAELSRTRGLLRNLPRESAPPELLESFESQLERSALLGDDDDEPSVELRMNRLPAITAWAAVLILTAGLAAVIYRVLPSNKTQPELALLKSAPDSAPPATAPVTDPDLARADAELAAKDALADRTAIGGRLAEAKSAASPAVPTASVAPPGAAYDKLTLAKDEPNYLHGTGADSSAPSVNAMTNVASNTGSLERRMIGGLIAPASDHAGEHAGDHAGEHAPGVYLVVHTIDPGTASAQLASYLNDNNIAFQSLAGPAAAISLNMPIDQQQLPNPTVQSLGSDDGQINRKQLGSQQVFTDMSVANGQRIQQLPPLPVSVGGASNVIIAHGLTPEQAKGLRDFSNLMSARGDAILAVRNGGEISPLATTMPAPTAEKALAQTAAPTTAPAIITTVARAQAAMTPVAPALAPAQAPTLPLAQATTYASTAPATAPADALLSTGDTVQIIAQDNTLKDVEAMNDRQTVDADGNLSLPLVGKVKVAGLDETESQQAIHLAYRLAKSPTDATWKVQRINRAPASQPAAQMINGFGLAESAPALNGASTQTSLEAVQFQAAQSQSAKTPSAQFSSAQSQAAQSQPAQAENSDRVDVAVLVCKADAVAKPTTEPAVPATLPTIPSEAPATAPSQN